MKIRREVKFTVEEVEDMKSKAFREAAIAAIGEPKDNEELTIEMSQYTDSIARIDPKKIVRPPPPVVVPGDTAEDGEIPATEGIF